MRRFNKQGLGLAWMKVRVAVSAFARSEAVGPGKRLFALLVCCMLAINGLNVVNSFVGRDFISSVESRDMPRFMWVSLLYVVVFGICTVVAVYYRFVEEHLGLLWRDWQTRGFLDRYLANRTYLRLAAGGAVENPDQRIAADVRAFATTSLSFFLMSLNAIITVIAFSGVMWSISPWLFTGAVVYGAIGSVVTILLGRRLVSLNNSQADREAAFRAELIQVKENAESLALLGRETPTKERLLGTFGRVVGNARHIIAVNRNVAFFTTGFNYLVPVIPVFVVAHLFMWGRVEFGVITQSAMAFAQLMGALSLIVTQFQSMSSYVAVVNRIRTLGEAMEAVEAGSAGIIMRFVENGGIAYENLTLKTPDGHTLVRNLTFTVPTGGRLLVASENHRAKRSLFRATAGLLLEGRGTISRPGDENVVFLPQRPYLPKSTLRGLVLNSTDAVTAGDRAEKALMAVGLNTLSHLYGGMDVEQDWSDVLLLEEQALLAVARALAAEPAFVILDHPEAVLNKQQRESVYRTFEERGIGHVTFGRVDHDPLLFDHVLRIEADGTWNPE